MRDLYLVRLADATHAVADGRVRLNGVPYQWEADVMVHLDRQFHSRKILG